MVSEDRDSANVRTLAAHKRKLHTKKGSRIGTSTHKDTGERRDLHYGSCDLELNRFFLTTLKMEQAFYLIHA